MIMDESTLKEAIKIQNILEELRSNRESFVRNSKRYSHHPTFTIRDYDKQILELERKLASL